MNKSPYLIAVAIAAAPLALQAGGLVPTHFSLGGRPVCEPVSEIEFTFNIPVEVAENSSATILAGDSQVAVGMLSASNYYGISTSQGTVCISFEDPLLLPKGLTYSVVVPQGAVSAENQPTLTNDEISAEFTVPSDIGDALPTVDNGSVVTKSSGLGFYYSVETAAATGDEMVLYRQDVPLRKYPKHVGWDWNLGYANIDFGRNVDFECGVEYTLKLPEGCVASRHRSDITNLETCVRFIGGSSEHVDPIRHVGCSLYGQAPPRILGEVRFYYDKPVELTVSPAIKLLDRSDNAVVMEAEPLVSVQDNEYVMTVDFEGFSLDPGKDYAIIMPACTLVDGNGGMAVNPDYTITLGSGTGVEECDAANPQIFLTQGRIDVTNMPRGAKAVLISLDGKIVSSACASDGSVCFPSMPAGLYLLSVNGSTHKIALSR